MINHFQTILPELQMSVNENVAPGFMDHLLAEELSGATLSLDLLENCTSNHVLVAIIRAIVAQKSGDMSKAERELELVFDAGEVHSGTKVGLSAYAALEAIYLDLGKAEAAIALREKLLRELTPGSED